MVTSSVGSDPSTDVLKQREKFITMKIEKECQRGTGTQEVESTGKKRMVRRENQTLPNHSQKTHKTFFFFFNFARGHMQLLERDTERESEKVSPVGCGHATIPSPPLGILGTHSHASSVF